MEDGDIKLHESLAIMTYILERYGEVCRAVRSCCATSDTGVCCPDTSRQKCKASHQR